MDIALRFISLGAPGEGIPGRLILNQDGNRDFRLPSGGKSSEPGVDGVKSGLGRTGLGRNLDAGNLGRPHDGMWPLHRMSRWVLDEGSRS